MTTSLSLREYQTDAVQTLSDFLLAGERELALVSPTGSGKTVILTAILATCKRQLIGAVVTVPTETIEANYSNEAVFYLTPQDASDLGVSVVDGKLDARGTYVNVRGLPAERREIEFNAVLAGVDKSRTGWAFVATHSQLVKYSPKKLPADLTDRLLVVDEAHHAAEEATQLGSYAAAWRSRGGATLYLTATPYRSDGHEVLSPDAAKFTHSIAKHAASGYAPSDFRVKTAALGVEVDDIEGWRGDALPEGEVVEGHGYEAILEQWEADGRPKAVFIVPGNRDSRSWAKRLISALPAGVNAFDAVGEESSKADDLQELLNYERGVRRFSDSLVDVIVACRRFDEGTDWPLCSAVYCVGVPRSFGLVAQRWGRSFRDKTSIAGYPEEHRNVAQITFLLAKLTAKGLEKFKGDHHEYAMLLGVYLADHEIGRLVGRQWDRRDPKEGAGKSRRDRVREQQREALDDRQCAEVQLRLVREAAQFEEAEGRSRTPEEWGAAVDAIEDPAERREAGRVVARWLATGAGVGDEDRARLVGMLPGTGINPVYRELFREAIQGVGAVAVDIVGMVARVMSQFTGEDATGVVARIRHAGGPLTVEEAKSEVALFVQIQGYAPSASMKERSPSGWSWGYILERLAQHGLSLQDVVPGVLPKPRGRRSRWSLPNGRLDVEGAKHQIEQVVSAYRTANDEADPPTAQGPASQTLVENLNPPCSWYALNQWMTLNLSVSLPVFLAHGWDSKGDARNLWDSGGLSAIRTAVLDFMVSTGHRPATLTEGGPIAGRTWLAANQHCCKHGTNLRALAAELVVQGLAPVSAMRIAPRTGTPILTMTTVEQEMERFLLRCGGRRPCTDEKADTCAGFSWDSANRLAKKNGTSLAAIAAKIQERLDPTAADQAAQRIQDKTTEKERIQEAGKHRRWVTTELEVVAAAERWLEKHGTWPGETTKGYVNDVWPDVPPGTRWMSVDHWLRGGGRGLPGGSSLLKIRGGRWTCTEAEVRQAAEAWEKKYGKWPGHTVGKEDVQEVWPAAPPGTKWDFVDSWLRSGQRGLPGGTSLAKLNGDGRNVSWKTTEAEILEAAERWRALYGEWPTQRTEGDVRVVWSSIPDGVAISWRAVDQWLRNGLRGLPPGGSLARMNEHRRSLSLTLIREEVLRYILANGMRPASTTKEDLCAGYPWSRAWAMANDNGTSLKQIAEELVAEGAVPAERVRRKTRWSQT